MGSPTSGSFQGATTLMPLYYSPISGRIEPNRIRGNIATRPIPSISQLGDRQRRGHSPKGVARAIKITG